MSVPPGPGVAEGRHFTQGKVVPEPGVAQGPLPARAINCIPFVQLSCAFNVMFGFL